LLRDCQCVSANGQIIFDTKNEIGKNLGILIAWIVVSLITISLGTWVTRRKTVNAHKKEMAERRQGM